jgi:transposase
MNRTRRHFNAEQKAEVVRRHLADKVPVSNLADELQIQPTLIHSWVKLVLDHAAAAFEATRGAAGHRRLEEAKDRRIDQLEAKLVKKNEVVAELMEAHVQLKKELGEL